MRIAHFGRIGVFTTCLQFNYPNINEINFMYGLGYMHGNEYTIALFKFQEKTPSEKAEWGSRLKELTN